MNIKFNVTLQELNKLNEENVLNIFEAFQNFMMMYEENMTFTEVERYWKKYDMVKAYIKKRFDIDNPERVIHDRIFTKH